MLDSEVNLREGLSNLAVPFMPVESKMDSAMKMDSNESNQLLSELELDASAVAQIDHLIDMALYFHLSLINDEAIDPSFVDPAISLVNVLHERYAGSELAQILRKSKDALTSAQVNQQGNALATDLSALINALDPWLLQGAPQHYSDLGLTLYRDTNSGQRWLQSAGTAANPYGDDEWRIQPWPKSNRGLNSTPTETHNEESNEPSEQMADPHAGHR
jgi:Cu(I)/Ag(I) efflux system membrane fusion protein